MHQQYASYKLLCQVVGAYIALAVVLAGQFHSIASPLHVPLLLAGTRAVGEGDDLVAWDTQATVPLPDINAKNKP